MKCLVDLSSLPGFLACQNFKNGETQQSTSVFSAMYEKESYFFGSIFYPLIFSVPYVLVTIIAGKPIILVTLIFQIIHVITIQINYSN
jgi:hypothetical protein